MSEEVLVVDKVESGVFFLLSLDSTLALLDQENARGLRDDLNEFLGADKEEPSVRAVLGCGSDEPNLPLGTVVIDNEGDLVMKVEGGWKWIRIGGRQVDYPSTYSWEYLTNEQMHQWFQVVA